jgi:hypothetical protein
MIRRFGIVTTCSEAGWSRYGAAMIESLLKHLPDAVNIYAYVDFKLKSRSPRLFVRKLADTCPGLFDFQNRLTGLDFGRAKRLASGGHGDQIPDRVRDAHKASFRAFTLKHAVLQATEDAMIWLDADIFAFDAVDPAFLEWAVPAQAMLSFLGRSAKPSECGFVAHNKAHPSTDAFVTAVADMYRTGAIFSLKDWRGSYVFDAVRQHFEVRGAETFDIGRPAAPLDEVFVNSEPGRVFAPRGAR